MNKVEITTARTTLRLIQTTDLEVIHAFHCIPEIDTYNTLGIPKNREETIGAVIPWIEDNNAPKIKNYTFAIENNSDEKFIGLFGFKLGSKKYNRAAVWYKIHPDFWSKGYATETLESMLDFGFGTLKLHRIQAGCAVDNIGSIKVLEKVGMTREGRGRQVLPLITGWSDNFEYSILETDTRHL